MASKSKKHFTVIKDTREQKGYHFGKIVRNRCDGMVVTKLDTGDYTLMGLEATICIERKASIEEIATNLGQKREAFMDEINRMSVFPHRFILLEFDLQNVLDFPNHEGSRIPESKRKSVKISSAYLMKCITEFQTIHGINVLFCGNKRNGFIMATNIFKRINEMYN